MGYNLHISRRRFWAEPVADDIAYEEWRLLAESDPEFEVRGETTWDLGKTLIEGDTGPGPTEEKLVTYHCYGFTNSPHYPSFDYHDGRVDVRGPDDLTFRKIFEVARRLGAVVQGDEGEYYRPTEHGVETSWDYPGPGSQAGGP